MSAPPVARPAARLAERVAWLEAPDWTAELARLAELPGEPGISARPPTFHEIARDGTALVEALARQARWDDATAQARRLRTFFGDQRATLSPIAGQAFDGLLAAAMARDPDELGDFSELVGELFPDPAG